MGIDEIMYGMILIFMIYNKFLVDIWKNIIWDKGDDNWDLNLLRRVIKKEFCV